MASNAKDLLRRSKTLIVEILSGDDLIYNKVHERGILTHREYNQFRNVTGQTRECAATKLVDKVMDKGDGTCTAFVNLLQEDSITETYPALRKILKLNPNIYVPTQEVGMKKDTPYKMTSDPRGLCVIINNENFNTIKKREGTQKDVDALVKVFSRLGFRVALCQDQTKEQMACALHYFASLNLAELQKCNVKEWSGDQFTEMKKPPLHGDAFVCCLLSHGCMGGVCGTDNVLLSTSEITSTFNGRACHALINKPKVFVIQACQGTSIQSGVLVDSAGTEEEMEVDDGPASTSPQLYYIPEEADFLIATSTIEKYVSFREPEKGSWFIQSLCQQLEIGCPSGDDILSIFTRVNKDVSEKEMRPNTPGTGKQMSEQRSTLRNKLYFPC